MVIDNDRAAVVGVAVPTSVGRSRGEKDLATGFIMMGSVTAKSAAVFLGSKDGI